MQVAGSFAIILMILFLSSSGCGATDDSPFSAEEVLPTSSPTVLTDSRRQFTASVTGVTPGQSVCQNLTTSQTVELHLGGTTSWNCEQSGLTFSPGDILNTAVVGVHSNTTADAGGIVTGILPLRANCFNLTTGQEVREIPLHGIGAWNCEQAGLTINEGDRIRMGVRGTIVARPSNTTCVAPNRFGTGVEIKQVFPNISLSELVLLLQAPGDPSRWFAAQRTGRVWVFANNELATTATTFVDITQRVHKGGSGLLGMAFHPHFASNGQVFLFYTGYGAPKTIQISRFVSVDGGLTLDPNSEQVLLSIPQVTRAHSGGGMAFGPDGYLYVGIGSDSIQDTQDTSHLYGTFIRIDVDHGNPYAIPPTNPFASGGGRPEIYAWGFRNPWRWSFDRGRPGDLWAGDVGARSWEEIDRVVLGKNYGWPIREAAHCYPPNVTTCTTTGLRDPVFEFPNAGGSTGVVGGYVYRGTAIPALQGVYVYGDLGVNSVWGLSKDATGQLTERPLIDGGRIPQQIWAFAEDVDGELYIVASTYSSTLPSQIYRLVPGRGYTGRVFPWRLSGTGCVDPTNPTQPVPGLIPYSINVPFWSNGASKRRWIGVPDGATIHIGTDGDWDLPIGTVLMKNFEFEDRLVETRFFVRHKDGTWAGYNYEWNAAQTEAFLLPRRNDTHYGKTVPINGQPYTYPSRSQCVHCHTPEAGHSLGLETAQMNRVVQAPLSLRGDFHQLALFEHLGLFDSPLPDFPTQLEALPRTTDGNAPLASRARAYLHSNCANCHRPDGPGAGLADFRFTTPETEMNICDQRPAGYTFRVPGARLLKPGNPAQSIISLRIHAITPFGSDLFGIAMPPLAKNVVDHNGAALIDKWIESIQQCP